MMPISTHPAFIETAPCPSGRPSLALTVDDHQHVVIASIQRMHRLHVRDSDGFAVSDLIRVGDAAVFRQCVKFILSHTGIIA